jgi:hypothetical protein
MSERISIPIKRHGGHKWGALAYLGPNHDICCEKGECIDQKYSFADGHRVRLFRFKKQVYWKIPDGVEIDISGVLPATPPRRQGGSR